MLPAMTEDSPGCGVMEDPPDIFLLACGIDGNKGAAQKDRREGGHDPAWGVGAKYGDPIKGCNVEAVQGLAQAPDRLIQFSPGNGVDVLCLSAGSIEPGREVDLVSVMNGAVSA